MTSSRRIPTPPQTSGPSTRSTSTARTRCASLKPCLSASSTNRGPCTAQTAWEAHSGSDGRPIQSASPHYWTANSCKQRLLGRPGRHSVTLRGARDQACVSRLR
nr:MAG TPA: hypothetical protein [Caudoviricetes sp.]